MSPGNFNLPMVVVVFVLVGLAIGLSLQFLGKDEIKKPDEVSPPTNTASDSSDEIIIVDAEDPIKNTASESIAPKTSDNGDMIILDEDDFDETINITTNTTMIILYEDEFMNEAIETMTMEPTLTSNVIELVQTIVVNNDENNNITLSCSLSSDGTRFAVSGTMNNEVCIYDYSSTYQLHVKTAKIIPDDGDNDQLMFGSVIRLSGDGDTVAIGSRFINNSSSIVQLY